MPNLELATATVAMPVWVVAAATALFAVIGALILMRAGTNIGGAVLRVGTVLIACGVAGLWFNQASLRERAAERRALDQRVSALDTRAIAPGSPLACLDAGAGDAVETACEKAVFATPQSVAEAVSYVTARLTLLADATEFARRGGYDNGLATLRLAIETDRYGIVAHVLSARNSCTPLLCDSYVLLHDADRVQANLRERLFDHYIERYSTEWAARTQSGTPVADAAGAPATTAAIAPAGPSAAAPVPSKYDFPSAASIPPVSIMAAEPSAPPQAKAEAKPETKVGTKPAAKAEAKPAAKAEAKPGAKAETKPGAAPKRAAQPSAPASHAPARTASGTPPPQVVGPPPSAPPGTQ